MNPCGSIIYLDAYIKLMEDYSKAAENFYKMIGASQHFMLTSLSTINEASLKSLENSLRQSIRRSAPPAGLIEEMKIDRMVQDILSGLQPVDPKEEKELNEIFDKYEQACETGAKKFKVGKKTFHMAG